MERHDGSEYLPAVFGGQAPHASQVIALMRFSQESTTWNLPGMISQTLLVAEIVRTYPSEIRMLLRVVRRGRPNVAEIFYMLIKYLALIAVVLDIMVTETFAAKSDFACRSWAWTASTFYFVCSTLVFCVIGWRARIIFRTSRVATWLISAGLVGQLVVSMWTNWRVVKADALTPAGTCAPAAQVNGENNASLTIHFWQSSTFWFLLYNTCFDLVLLVACCVRLQKTSSGPGGLTRIAKMLFLNNIHYMAGVETCNLIELLMLLAWASSLPPVHMTSIAIQIVVGLQMLIGEQEAVHGPTTSRVNYSTAPSSSLTSSYAKPYATHSDNSYTMPARALSYVRRPGTANTAHTATEGTFGANRARKNTITSISSVPAYSQSVREETLPQPPSRANTAPAQAEQVAIEMPPLPASKAAPKSST